MSNNNEELIDVFYSAPKRSDAFDKTLHINKNTNLGSIKIAVQYIYKTAYMKWRSVTQSVVASRFIKDVDDVPHILFKLQVPIKFFLSCYIFILKYDTTHVSKDVIRINEIFPYFIDFEFEHIQKLASLSNRNTDPNVVNTDLSRVNTLWGNALNSYQNVHEMLKYVTEVLVTKALKDKIIINHLHTLSEDGEILYVINNNTMTATATVDGATATAVSAATAAVTSEDEEREGDVRRGSHPIPSTSQRYGLESESDRVVQIIQAAYTVTEEQLLSTVINHADKIHDLLYTTGGKQNVWFKLFDVLYTRHKPLITSITDTYYIVDDSYSDLYKFVTEIMLLLVSFAGDDKNIIDRYTINETRLLYLYQSMVTLATAIVQGKKIYK